MKKQDNFLKLFVKRGKRISWVELDKRMLLIDTNSHKTYYLEGIGGLIWLLIKEPLTVKRICNKIIDKYNITFILAYRDIKNFLRKMQKAHVVIITEKPSK